MVQKSTHGMLFGSQVLGLGLMIQIYGVHSECGPSNSSSPCLKKIKRTIYHYNLWTFEWNDRNLEEINLAEISAVIVSNTVFWFLLYIWCKRPSQSTNQGFIEA